MERFTRSSPAALSLPARCLSPSPLVVSEISGFLPVHVRNAAVFSTIPSSPLRRRGSPPVNRTSSIPKSSTPIRISRLISSSLRSIWLGRGSIPSAGIQYWQRRLHLSVKDTRRSVATRPKLSIRRGSAGTFLVTAACRVRVRGITCETTGLTGTDVVLIIP